jgi:ribonuclease HI
MGGLGAVLHAQPTRNENTPSGAAPLTGAGLHRSSETSVPARGLFTPSDAEPSSINQRDLLAAIPGLRTSLLVARKQRVQLLSDSQLSLAGIRNWSTPRIMVLLRILRRLCEENGISLGLQYIPNVLKVWVKKLSRSSDWALTPSSLAQIRNHLHHHHNITIHTKDFARRDTVVPGARHFHSPTGTGSHDPAGHPLRHCTAKRHGLPRWDSPS